MVLLEWLAAIALDFVKLLLVVKIWLEVLLSKYLHFILILPSQCI